MKLIENNYHWYLIAKLWHCVYKHFLIKDVLDPTNHDFYSFMQLSREKLSSYIAFFKLMGLDQLLNSLTYIKISLADAPSGAKFKFLPTLFKKT